jgi:hypothetical protein
MAVRGLPFPSPAAASAVLTVMFPKDGQATRSESFLRYPCRSKNYLFLLSAAQAIADLFGIETCSTILMWPSLGILRYVQAFN